MDGPAGVSPGFAAPGGMGGSPGGMGGAPQGQVSGDCAVQMSKLQKRRGEEMDAVNKTLSSGKGPGGKVDPVVACPKLRSLAAAEATMRTYMEKNKTTCGIPDEVMTQMREGFAKTPEFAQRACQAAAQMKKMQQPAGRRRRRRGGPRRQTSQRPALSRRA